MRQKSSFVSRKSVLGFAMSFGLIASLTASPEIWAAASRITSIDFKTAPGASLVEIASDAPLAFTKTENSQDRQVVIELPNAKLAKSASRKLDTSSFASKVSLVSPYQVEGDGETARVVIQLRSAATAEVSQEGNVLRVRVPEGGASPAAASVSPETEAAAEAPAEPAAPVAAAVAEPAATASSPVAPSAPTAKSNRSNLRADEKALEEFIEARSQRKYIGKPITLQVRDMDLMDFFQLIGEASGFNVIVGSEVQGKVTLSLADTPWDQALDLVLSSKQLGAERRNNVLRITTLSNLTAEKQAELAARRASEAAAPRITRVFPISYARLGDISNVFQRFGSASGEGSQTVVQQDDRTNSIIVRDTAENIDRMRKLIEILDTQTPQVLIEAKVIEASENQAHSIGGGLGLGQGADGSASSGFGASFSGGSTAATATALSTLGTASGGGAAFGLSQDIGFGFFNGSNVRLNASLTLLDSQSKIKVISSPKTVVLNKESASIVAGQPILVVTTATTTTGPIRTTQVSSANLSLNVRPTVTNDSSVMLDVSVQRDVPRTLTVGDLTSQASAGRTINTKVLVDSGATLVIGGIYSSQIEERESGIPFFRKIPIIGHLFGTESSSNDRSELFIFITPRILNEKEAGLST